MRIRRPTQPRPDARPWGTPHAAGLASGSEEIWACVPEDRAPQPVQSFGTFTPALYTLAAWLPACRIETVAREATGVYWMPVSEMLEARGFQVHLVNARHRKHVPGRKPEVKDCQWLPDLHTCGLRSPSFRPAAERCAWRAYGRRRATWLAYRAAPIQHMQKAVPQMHVQWSQVRTDSTGATGLAILRAIVAAERDPVDLARCREPRGAHRTEDIAQALTGPDRAEHVFARPQARARYDVDTAQGRECDAAIARHFQAITPVWDNDLPPLDRGDKALSQSQNAPAYEARRLVSQLTGVDWVAIPGLHASTVQPSIAAIGLDMGKWPNATAFCAWLGLAPRHEISGGTVLRRGTLQTRTRAGQALRLAAQAAGRSQRGLGAFYRRLRARCGPQAAIVATAHKNARIIYHLRTRRTPFRDRSPEEYSQRIRARAIAAMRKQAARLGLTLVESQA
jgi:transposase